MPDLGAYAVNVLAAYGFGLTVLVVVVALSFRASGRARRDLAALERGRDG